MPIPAGLGNAELPDWAPVRENVADYVPHRTLKKTTATTTAGQDVYGLTFDGTTRPTGSAVDRLIRDGITYVTGRLPALPAGQEATAGLIATLYAASAVERSWPHDDQSLQRATDMEKRMESLMAGLVEAAGPSRGDNLLPAWSFPTPAPWGDDLL
ncbi:hypothetical protein ABZ671_00830 [Micromonospora sp. NPDC006766]|uniref:hypothetical protein n=1 Tax=Micromonospora sp. NPDC006766 TaxID=3154778 RepID=UPI003406F4A1